MMFKSVVNSSFVQNIKMRFPPTGHREAPGCRRTVVLPGLCSAERFWEIPSRTGYALSTSPVDYGYNEESATEAFLIVTDWEIR